MTRPRSLAIRQSFSDVNPLSWLTHIAFVIGLAIIIARLTTPDALRDPWGPTPEAAPTAAGPGAGTSLVFDLVALLPGVLVLIRSAIDREYVISRRWSYPILFALAILSVLSSVWASDRFLAVVSAAHFFSASCLLWAMSQLVRSAARFRIVSAVAFGLLLVLVVQSMMYRFVEVPANVSYWNEKKADILKARGWKADSFAAKQFEHKLTSGEPIGFFNSPNSLAAAGVLLFAACAGLGIQKVKEGEAFQWIILTAVGAGSLVWILIDARSKTSAATPIVGAIVLGGFVLFRDKIKANHFKSFLGGSIAVALGVVAVVGHGIYHRGLFPGHFSNSLDFRWKYWTASVDIFRTHPLLGVGWGNFGLSYLAHRLPEAAEEIKDPHNFVIRFLTELGFIGATLCVGWLMRVAWEITEPKTETGNLPREISPTIRTVVTSLVLGMFLYVGANVDFSLSWVDTILLLLKPLLFMLTLLLGALAGSMRSPHAWTVDSRPTEWIFYFLVTGLGLFLLHNLIDFSWFEPGAMICFMALIGSALGMARQTSTARNGRWIAIVFAGGASVGWLAIAAFFVLPVVLGEAAASAGDQAIQTAPAEHNANALAHYRSAAYDYSRAAMLVPYNSDYVFRQAQATMNTGDYSAAQALLQRVQKMDPLHIDAYLLDANLRLTAPAANQTIVRADFERATALNPNDVTLHIQYAHALEHFGAIEEAKRQYRLALAANAALPIGEPKRLNDPEVAQLEKAAQ